jgi:hypothetical protein
MLPSESVSTASGWKIWISDVPSRGIFSTKVKLDKEEDDDEDTIPVTLLDDSNTRLRTSITKTIKMNCNMEISAG